MDEALLSAAVDEFIERGFKSMSMESIAARAGVSKVSLYRRWNSKEEAVAEVLKTMGESTLVADYGSLEADLRALLRETVESPEASRTARMILRTMGEISEDPTLLALYRERILEPRLLQARTLIDRARARGELRKDLSTDIAVSLIGGPIFLYHLALFTGLDRPSDPTDSLLGAVMNGIAIGSQARKAKPRNQRRN